MAAKNAAPEATHNDPWQEMVKIKLPRPAQGEDNYITASVNGRFFQIMKGVEVEVPAPIAEVLEHSEEAKDYADEYMNEVVGN